MTNLGSIGGAPDPTTVPEVYTGMRKLHADQGYSQARQPVCIVCYMYTHTHRGAAQQQCYAVYAESLPDPNGLIHREERRVRQ